MKTLYILTRLLTQPESAKLHLNRLLGTTPLTGERAQASLRGRPRGRLGSVESGKGCLRGRPRGRLGTVGSGPVALRGRPRRFGSTQGAGATLKRSKSEILQM